MRGYGCDIQGYRVYASGRGRWSGQHTAWRMDEGSKAPGAGDGLYLIIYVLLSCNECVIGHPAACIRFTYSMTSRLARSMRSELKGLR